jgi:GT2 family glycosyltransferase
MPELTIITVCYNSSRVLPELLASVPPGVPVVLVNNSQNDPLDHLQGDDVTVISLPENTGFGNACNTGASVAKTDYLLFLNPDTRLAEGAVTALMHAAREHPEASAFNPVLTDSDGRLRNKRRSVLLPRGTRLSADQVQKDGTVPVLIGAALLVRRDAFEAVGGFDRGIFLYHEDDDLSLRLATQGPLRIAARAHVTHIAGHGSGDRTASAGIKAYHMGRSRVYAMRKHGRPFPKLRSFGWAALQLASPFTWLSRRKRTKQLEFLRGVLSDPGVT